MISLNLPFIRLKAILILRERGISGMSSSMELRVAYGRSIRERAAAMIEAHGALAGAEALHAAEEAGVTAADRAFWQAVAARIARELGERAPMPA